MLVIFTASSVPASEMPDVFPLGVDKIVHLAAYAVLGFALIRAFLGVTSINLAKCAVLSIIIGSLFAVSDEWHQSFVPGRIMDKMDLLADFLGLNIGVLLRSVRK